MAPAQTKSARNAQQQRDRRSKIAAVGLSGVLVIVLAIQVPKLMKSGGAATAVTTTASSDTVRPPGVTPDTTSVSASAPPPTQLIAFTHFAYKDPFRPQVQTSTTASAATTSSGQGAGTPKPSVPTTAPPPPTTRPPAVQHQPPAQHTKVPAKKPKHAAKKQKKAKPKPKPPNAVVIRWNGKRELVPVGVSFPSRSPLFKLVALNRRQKVARIGVLDGSFTSGAPTLPVHAGQKLTLANESDGSRYVFTVVRLVAATPSQIAAATPETTTTPGTTTSATTTTAAATTTTPADKTTSPFALIPGATG